MTGAAGGGFRPPLRCVCVVCVWGVGGGLGEVERREAPRGGGGARRRGWPGTGAVTGVSPDAGRGGAARWWSGIVGVCRGNF
jgi:hypothetical protein